MRTPIGATSYVFRYLLSDATRAPTLSKLLERARSAGIERLQVCENARPLEVSCSDWTALRRQADDLGLELTLGCMTLDPEVVHQYLERVQAIGGSFLRIVLEREGVGPLSLDRIRLFLDHILPELESQQVRLAIENHFEIPSRVLAQAVADYPRSSIGFCVDVANSLRNFEDSDTVLDLLGDRAFCYHFKDYRITGSNVGFAVTGTPFGEGQIDGARLLCRAFSRTQAPAIYLETWTPCTDNWETDVATDAAWLRISIANLGTALSSMAPAR